MGQNIHPTSGAKLNYKQRNIFQLVTIDYATYHLPSGKHYMRCKLPLPKDELSIVSNFYGIGVERMHSTALMDLFNFIAVEPYRAFYEKFNANFIVQHSQHYYGITGYTTSFKFNESVYDADHIDGLIEHYRSGLVGYVENMSDELFAKSKATVYDEYDLCDRSAIYWTEILMREYDFVWFDGKIKCLAKITKSEFIKFVQVHILQEQYKLSIHLVRDPLAECISRLDIMSTEISFIESTAEHFFRDLDAFRDKIYSYQSAYSIGQYKRGGAP